MKNLISVKPSLWNVDVKYLNKDGGNGGSGSTTAPNKLKFLQKMKTIGNNKRKKLVVDGLSDQSMVFTLDEDGEYYKNGKSLTALLELSAKIGNSKIQIRELV